MPIDLYNRNQVKICLNTRKHYTPDFRDIIREEKIVVFVWDNYKKDCINNYLLGSEDYLGKAVTLTNDYLMKSENDFPYIRRLSDKDKTPLRNYLAKVAGEAYAIKPEVLLRLDACMLNGEASFRVSRYVHLLEQVPPYKSNKGVLLKVFMYETDLAYFMAKSTKANFCTTLKQSDGEWAYEWTRKKHLTTN